MTKIVDIVNFNADASCLESERWLAALRGNEGSYAVIVAHQDVSWDDISRFLAKRDVRAAILLTTHHLFRTERVALTHKCPIDWAFAECADFLSDAEMAECDEEATRRLSDSRHRMARLGTYASEFMSLSQRLKNERLLGKVKAIAGSAVLCYAAGLGVDGGVWAAAGGVALQHEEIPDPPQAATCMPAGSSGLLRRFAARVRREFVGGMPLEATVVYDAVNCYVFLTSTKRLHFEAAYKQKRTIQISAMRLKVLRRLHSGESLYKRALKCTALRGRNPILCTTIHEYTPSMICDDVPLWVFTDGFHPSNYPRSYVDAYADTQIVVDCPLSAQWFSKYGYRVLHAPSFIKRPVMAHVKYGRPVRNVLLALNHAGDWTSLVNRSDTDRLVESFVQTASRFPHLRFIVRAHPSMSHPSHEGRLARIRLRKFCQDAGCPNVDFSSRALEEDLSCADVCVSEYSQVLIEAMRRGILSIIVNVTGRRSFMADYERLGFPCASSNDELAQTVGTCVENPATAASRQNAAVDRYNELLARWHSEAL